MKNISQIIFASIVGIIAGVILALAYIVKIIFVLFIKIPFRKFQKKKKSHFRNVLLKTENPLPEYMNRT